MALHVADRGLPGRFAPASLVAVLRVVEDFPVGNRRVAGPLEGFGQGDRAGRVPVCPGVAVEARAGGKDSRHQTRPRPHADRNLAIGAVETHALRGELVEVRSFDLRAAVTPEFRAQIVDGNEEDVGLL
jgi:hypothetical protein